MSRALAAHHLSSFLWSSEAALGLPADCLLLVLLDCCCSLLAFRSRFPKNVSFFHLPLHVARFRERGKNRMHMLLISQASLALWSPILLAMAFKCFQSQWALVKMPWKKDLLWESNQFLANPTYGFILWMNSTTLLNAVTCNILTLYDACPPLHVMW